MELKITRLTKTYPNGTQALKQLDLHIPTGMFGLLGPNGAGKSTLMRTIATLQEPDSGEIMLGNINVLKQKEEVRKVLGYLPQEFGVYPRISAEVLLDHFAQLKGIADNGERRQMVETLLHRTNLWEHRKKNLGGFSGGMKQRFGIAQALLGSPKLIIVDEPTAGLDPAERNRFHNLLSEISEQIIVILSTHIIEDVQSLCSQMAVINRGQVLLNGKPTEVLHQYEGRIWRKLINKRALEDYRSLEVISNRLVSGLTELTVYAEIQPEQGFEQRPANLEDVYFSVISKRQKDV